MKVHVKLFAILRDRAGVSDVTLDLPPGATVTQASSNLAAQLPLIRELAASCAYAVNYAYAKPDTVLSDADELALIPPVSGGNAGDCGSGGREPAGPA